MINATYCVMIYNDRMWDVTLTNPIEINVFLYDQVGISLFKD